ncbi:MAG: DNA-processing protein DprA [Parvibaculales bacterium]
MRNFTEHQRRDALRLIRTERLGPVTYHKLLELYKDPSEALRQVPELAKRGGSARKPKIMSRAAADREIKATAKIGGQMIVCGENNYPVELAAIPDAPPVLSVLGHLHLLKPHKIAIVGARNASLNGRKMTERLAAGLSSKGFVIVSGMARGIDAYAHHHSLDYGSIAVLAGGVDNVYPNENAELYDRLKQEGLIMSENALGTKPLAHYFPRRNRIISGLSLGVIVTEAALRSGSLITARFTGEQGREIFAVPGSPLDPRCRGANNLIRQGGTLVETVDDVLEVIRPLSERSEEPSAVAPDDDKPVQLDVTDTMRREVINLLGTSPTSIDELVAHTGYSPMSVHMVVIELELAGRLIRDHMGIMLNIDTEED